MVLDDDTLKEMMKSLFDGKTNPMLEKLASAGAKVRLRAFVAAFAECVDEGVMKTFSEASRKFYDQLIEQGFTEDDAIRIISHSFTRMISEGG